MNSKQADVTNSKQSFARQCVVCGTALAGLLGYLFRIVGISRSTRNPNLCTRCNTHVEEGSIVEISVLFADLSSFTELTQELGPKRTHEVIDAFLKMATNILVKHYGFIDRYIGDAVMAFFNAPVQRDDHAAQAVDAALEIQAGMSQLQERFGLDLKAGVGIATGWARVGRIGSEDRKDYTAIGDVVNLAARLEGQARPGEILIHSRVYEEVAADFPDTPSESLWLKGFREPTLTYYLRSTTDLSQYTHTKEFEPKLHMGLGAVIFAILGAPCAAAVLIGPLAIVLGFGTLFGAMSSYWMVFDKPLIRLPLLILATLGSLAILYTVWHARKLRQQQAKAKGDFIAMTQLERRRTVIVTGLAIATLMVVALAVCVHSFHWFM